MNKKTILWSVLMVAVLLMPVGLAEPELVPRFTFMDAITWDSTPEKVESTLGEGVERAEKTIEAIGTVTVLRTENESFAGYKCSRMAFLYYNNKLCYINCYYFEADVGDTASLIKEMTKIYGIPHMNESNTYSLEDYINGNKTMCDWNIGDDTNIKVVDYNEHSIFPQQEEEYPYFCLVSFENTPIAKQFQEALDMWAANSETEPG